MKKIVINADDYGATKKISNEINSLYRKGYISSTTVIANSDNLCRCTETISYGLHINFIEFNALTNTQYFIEKGICNEHGVFNGNIRNIKLFSPYFCFKLYEEVKEQLYIAKNAGYEITHFDSHQHVHTKPGLLPLLLFIRINTGISKIRNTRMYPDSNKKIVVLLFKKLWTFILKKILRFQTSDFFCSYTEFYEKREEIIKSNKNIEVMLHPGLDEFEQENELFLSTIEYILNDIELVKFKDLVKD